MADPTPQTAVEATPPSESLWPRITQRLRLLPLSEDQPSTPPTGRRLVGLSLWLFVAVVLAILNVRGTTDPWPLVLSLAIIAMISGYSVGSVGGADTTWSVNDFMHLGIAFTYGPLGCLCAAVIDIAAYTILQQRAGWDRFTFNVANIFLADLAAWYVFHELSGTAPITWGTGLITLLGGVVLFVAQTIPIAVFVRAPVVRFLWDSTKEQLLYNVGYGWAALAFIAMYRSVGLLGVALVVTPVVLLQGFLVVLARRVYAHEQETLAHQAARERLLQQAIDASNDERERIASDIHDGVVQDLAGLAFTLGAYNNIDLATMEPKKLKEVQALFAEGANTAREATKDLRTLMIDIAPPKLRQLGLRAALKDLLKHTGAQLKGRLKMAKEIDSLGESQQRLVYRVAQEALRNCLKHSQAKEVVITVAEEGDQVILTVADNGKGFSSADRQKRQEEGHVGLGLLGRTVSDGGGTLEINSEPGKGTTVEMRVRAAATSEK